MPSCHRRQQDAAPATIASSPVSTSPEAAAPAASPDSAATCRWLREFVLSYERHHSDSLLFSHMTPHARDIYDRMVMEHDCDMLVMAQDIPDDFEQMLSFRSLGADWYLMEYHVGDSIVTNRFYMTGNNQGEGTRRIAFIEGFPSSKETGRMFYGKKPEVPVSKESAAKFLHSFYQKYAAVYCSLDADVAHETEVLRQQYLSPLAQQQYTDYAKDYLEDGMDGFDILIGGFYTKLEKERRRTFLETANGHFIINDCLELSVHKDSEDKGWIIDDIHLSSVSPHSSPM